MSYWNTYLSYIKNNPDGYWFRRKLYGWGWTPATWQGWLVLVAFVAAVVLNFWRIDSMSHSDSDILIQFIPQTIIITAVLIFVCYRTGEKPRWQWGIPEDEGKITTHNDHA